MHDGLPFLRLISAYRPPSTNSSEHAEFTDCLSDLCSILLPVLLCGDFSLPSIDWLRHAGSSAQDHAFIELCNSADLSQLVRFSTRLTATLDLLLVSIPQNVSGLKCVPGLLGSDHFGFLFDYHCPFIPIRSRLIPRYSAGDFASINHVFYSVDWLSLRGKCSSVSEFYSRFCSVVLGDMSSSIPVAEARDRFTDIPSYISKLAKHRENLAEKRHIVSIQGDLEATSTKLKRCLKNSGPKRTSFFQKSQLGHLVSPYHQSPKITKPKSRGSAR